MRFILHMCPFSQEALYMCICKVYMYMCVCKVDDFFILFVLGGISH